MTSHRLLLAEENPEPLLGSLVEKVAYVNLRFGWYSGTNQTPIFRHKLHGSALQLHKDTRQWKDNVKKTMAQRARQLKRSHPNSGSVDYSQSFTGDEVNFWTPQVRVY